jgi:mono/diheme cytochrome c family protein
MTKPNAFLALVVATACGGGSKPAPAAPVHDPIPMFEGPPAQDAVHATPPVSPIQPESPAEAPPDPAKIKAELLAAETAAYEKAKPVFDKHCAKCHTKTGTKTSQKKLGHFDMTTYPFGGHHAMEIAAEIRKSLGIDGRKPTMPFDKKGAVKGEELALIAAWADAFDASHNAGAHEGHDGHHHHGGHKH